MYLANRAEKNKYFKFKIKFLKKEKKKIVGNLKNI